MADFSASDLATSGIATQSITESVNSQLPGRNNGPADAYRHLLLSAELTRQFGEGYARAALDFHEWDGNRAGQAADTNRMDEHNNELGIALGKRLAAQPSSSWQDVVAGARALIDAAPNQAAGVQWLKEDRWQMNPMGPDQKRLPTGDARINWPAQWPEGPFPNPEGRDAGEPYKEEVPVKTMDHMVPPRQPEKDLFDRLRENVESILDERYGRLHTEAEAARWAAGAPTAADPGHPDHRTYQALLSGVQKIGRWDQGMSENIAANLLLAVKNDPMIKQVDAVVANAQGASTPLVFAAYMPNAQGPNFHVRVDAELAAATPAQESLRQAAQVEQQISERRSQSQSIETSGGPRMS
ncbi:hypothetical protein J5226_06920 [Lysobacter sp. K5869]|uniref:XVIPCD domain-containing protein n=1 Tax=Lysobacter sp. K5869 TaxID=2820808 RepID=UPI001C06039A|nr:XVIPCD domain-containing protein [Lysobacter sp. K5869]QWP78122.1 hypothetical protein J5226_06920 [Lysobacter sp. K5869]